MRVEFGFGIGFDRDNVPINAGVAARAVKQILVEASRMFGGCNLLRGQGAWIDPQGTLILEESCTLVVDIVRSDRFPAESDAVTNMAVDKLATFIRSELNQTAVHVTRLVASSRVVYAGQH